MVFRRAMSSWERVTSRNCPEFWPTSPAITDPAPPCRVIRTRMGSLNMTPVRICPSVIVTSLTGHWSLILGFGVNSSRIPGTLPGTQCS